MVLAPVNELSDAEPAPQNASGSTKDTEPEVPIPKDVPKPKGKAKATGKSGKAKAQAKEKPKGKAKLKAKPALKRPASAASAADQVLDDQEPAMKKPAALSWSVNKYIYHRDGVWGIKVNKREVYRVGSLLKNTFKHIQIQCSCLLLLFC